MPKSTYKSHSFKIGAASDSFNMGISELEIKRKGRWNSEVYKRYIRNWIFNLSFILDQENLVWVIGSSIIKWAFFRARRSLFRADLSIKRFNGRIFWQGKGGMSWKDLFPKVKLPQKYEQTPNILIIHCGGNDIRKIKIKNIRETMKITYYKLKSLLPNTRFCWSSILPRTNWIYS